MNKLVKGSLAGAAGIALLLGGAGTFALWNATASVSGQSITAGTLTLTANADGLWKKDGVAITPSTYRIIPGTVLDFTQTLTVNAVGDGLKATLAYSGFTGSNTLDPLLAKTLYVSSATATVDGSTLKFIAGSSTVNVKFTLVFPQTATTGQSSVVDLSALNFTLTQTVA
jgi:alternate signal-mediated exported protein